MFLLEDKRNGHSLRTSASSAIRIRIRVSTCVRMVICVYAFAFYIHMKAMVLTPLWPEATLMAVRLHPNPPFEENIRGRRLVARISTCQKF